jgi:hypothetical protein
MVDTGVVSALQSLGVKNVRFDVRDARLTRDELEYVGGWESE